VQQFADATGGNPIVEVDVFVEHDGIVVPRLTGQNQIQPGPRIKVPNNQEDPHQKPAKHANAKRRCLSV